MDWKILVAGLINSVIVVGLVQAIKLYWPSIRERIPALLPIFAAALGPAVAVAQNTISGWLGVPIDLSPLVGAFTGAAAVAIHQVGVQARQ